VITIETPLRAVQTQREILRAALENASPTDATRIARIEGALAVLDWLEHGHPLPVERV
jgi:hypothetical protein